jgi:hypothetical protein
MAPGLLTCWMEEWKMSKQFKKQNNNHKNT